MLVVIAGRWSERRSSERHIAGDSVPTTGDAGNIRRRVADEIVGLIDAAEADRVIAQMPRAFGLQAISFVALVGGLRNAVVEQIADRRRA
jgi:hypothetical protein